MGSGTVGNELDLKPVIEELLDNSRVIEDVEYQNESMVTFRLIGKTPAITLYRTGSFQIRGAKSKKDLQSIKDQFLAVLGEAGIPAESPTFEQKTAVVLEDMDISLDLESLATLLGIQNVDYEPEQFSGLIFRPPTLEATLLIFSSGKVIIGGTLDKEHAVDGIQQVRDSLLESNND